jgi:L-alanine-DL-glutamate epimerase-like enolase superfamily enzyme
VAGKATGLPVHALLGGKLNDRVRACAPVILNTTDLEALAAAWLEDAVHHEDHDGYRRLRSRSQRASAAGP